jgi:hypothetical protein
MTNPNDSPYKLAMRIVSGFLLAALATFIPIAAVGLYILWVDRGKPPPPPPTMIGGPGLVFAVGLLCSLVAGIVGAFLGGYRFHLGRMVFGLLVGVSLAIAVVWSQVFVDL